MGVVLLDLASSLSCARPFLPDGLVDERATQRLSQIAPFLPPSFVSGTFECRLNDDPQVDYQLCFTDASGGRERLATWLESLDPSSVPPGWARTIEFLRGWATPGARLSRNSPAAWLEFDCSRHQNTPPAPFPFFSMPPPWGEGRLAPAEIWKTVEEGFARLRGGKIDTATMDGLIVCLTRLPSFHCLLHAALRPERGRSLVRLIVRLPLHEIPDYLERIGWRHPLPPLRRFLSRYCPTSQVHTLQFDVDGAEIGSRLGIEIYDRGLPSVARCWVDLFDRLTAAGACSQRRRRQLEEWAAPRVPGKADVILRGLLVKLVYEIDELSAAKAYLPFCVNPWLANWMARDESGMTRSGECLPSATGESPFDRSLADATLGSFA